MGLNEIILIGSALISILLIYVAWKFDRERLFSVMLIFLILIAIGGGKIVEFFGHVTNTGNIFYASIFLATYLLIERHGSREGIRSIWVGVIGVLFFSVLLQLVIALVGSPLTGNLNTALGVAFAPLSRLAFASLMGYIFAQSLNVFLYVYLKDRYPHQNVWVRANITNFVAQIVDSIVFFTIAFVGVVTPENMWEVLITGFFMKVLFMVCAAPLLFCNKMQEEESEEGARITFW